MTAIKALGILAEPCWKYRAYNGATVRGLGSRGPGRCLETGDQLIGLKRHTIPFTLLLTSGCEVSHLSPGGCRCLAFLSLIHPSQGLNFAVVDRGNSAGAKARVSAVKGKTRATETWGGVVNQMKDRCLS